MALVKLEEKNQIAEVTLNRPDVRNAFNPEMIQELTDIFTQFNQRKDLRLLVLKGEGSVFCAGADLNWMKSMITYSLEENQTDAEKLFLMFEAIQNCIHPIMTVVQGAAMGGALGLLAASDVVIATEPTQFAFSEVKLGIAPAVISSFVLSKIEPRKVSAYMISGKAFDGTTAKDMGLVHEVVSERDLSAKLLEWQKTFLEAAPEAVRESKKLLSHLKLQSLAEQKKATTLLIAERRVSAEGQEGLKSFLEKRKPSWRPS